MARRTTKRVVPPERRLGGERFARKVYLVAGALGVLFGASCLLSSSSVFDLSSDAFIEAVLAIPLLWVGARGTYVTSRKIRRLRREIRANSDGAAP